MSAACNMFWASGGVALAFNCPSPSTISCCEESQIVGIFLSLHGNDSCAIESRVCKHPVYRHRFREPLN